MVEAPVRKQDVPESTDTSKKKRIYPRIALGLAAAYLATPTIHSPNQVRVLEALTGRDINCVGSAQPATHGYEADVIAVPGATSKMGSDGKLVPNYHGKVRLRAAAYELFEGKAPNVAILAGKPTEVDPEKNLAAHEKFLKEEYKKIAGKEFDGRIMKDMSSANTAENIVVLDALIKNNHLSVAKMITEGYHLPRTLIYTCAHNIAASGEAAELILKRKESKFKYIEASAKERRKEQLEIGAAFFDNKGIVTSAANRLVYER